MASHGVSWVLGAHVCFGNLDFIITTEGELMQAPVAVQPLHSSGLDAITEALEELRLHAPEARASGSDQLLGFDYRRLERQLGAFLGPRPPREDLHHLTFSFANIMMQLAGVEPLSPEYLMAHPERPNSAPVRSPQHRRDRWPPCGAMHASIPYE